MTIPTILLAGLLAAADEPRLAEYYGFKPLEIYKLDARIAGLMVRDLDGDKTDDVAVINNGRSRIDLLLSGAGPSDDRGEGDEANRVPSDRRMRRRSIPVNHEVVSLASGDFDGDGRPDLAYYGTPAELVVLRNEGNGRFTPLRRINVGEAAESLSALAVGDIDRDGRDDLVLLAPEDVILVFQAEKGRLSDPERLPHTATRPGLLKVTDLDGDGGDDLVILDGGSDHPIHVRFSVAGGRLGPEQRFATETPRAIAFADLDGRKGAEILTIELQSGRARVLTLDDSPEEAVDRRGHLAFYPLPRGDARGRATAVADLDGDGKLDVVVSDPSNAQLLVFRQGKAGLGPMQPTPGLAGGRTIAAADLDGDGKAEVAVLSESERQIGLTRFEGGRLRFPTPLPLLGGEPVGLALADLDGDDRAEVVYLTRETGASATGGEYRLRALRRDKAGAFVPFRWGPDDSVAVAGLSGGPQAVRVLDANRDGRPDILIFHSGRSPILLLGRAGAAPPAPAGGSLGPLVGATSAGLATRTPEGPGLLIAHGGFARAVTLDKDSGQWEIADQYNAGRSSAQVAGAAAIDVDGDGVPEVALFDRASKSLLFLAKKDGVYRPAGTLSVGPLDFQGATVADLDGDGKPDLLLAGTDRLGVVSTGRKGQRLRPLAGYEPRRRESQYADLIAGDLNADGRPDLALIDVGEHAVEILALTAPTELSHALGFKVFETKTRSRDEMEPRDLALGDVDGDGRPDLVLISHDRILIYRQDPGEKKAETARR